MLTAKRLKELLHYDPLSGVFTWQVNRGKAAKGRIAGTLNEKGYIQICVDSRLHRAHRLAWLYVHGTLPEGGIDHRDGNPANNAMSNLRIASQAENTLNRRASKRSKTGVKNVYPHPTSGYVVRMLTTKGYQHLGSFRDLESASTFAAIERAKHHGEFANDGTNP